MGEIDYTQPPDPETQPEPYFDGMFWDEITGELDRLEREAWEERAMEEMYYDEMSRDYPDGF